MPRPPTRRGRARARARQRGSPTSSRAARARRIDELRAQHGLPPLGRSVNAHARPAAAVPRREHPRARLLDRRDLPPGVHYVGPLLWHPPDAARDDRVARRAPGRPARGCTSPRARRTTRTRSSCAPRPPGLAGAALRGDPDDGPRPRPRARLGLPEAPNVHVTTWARTRRAAAPLRVVVTTGGAGTIMAGAARRRAARRSSRRRWDKPDNARRMVEAGVAVRLSPRRCTPEALRAAVEQVLGDPRYRANARQHRAAAGRGARAGRRGRRSSRRSCPATAAATGRRRVAEEGAPA